MQSQWLRTAVGGNLGTMLQVVITDLSSHPPRLCTARGSHTGGHWERRNLHRGSFSLSLQRPGGAALSSLLCRAAKTSPK